MQAELVNPFIAAAGDVFRDMLQCELTRGPLALKRGSTPEYEVSGLIGLTGKLQGMVVLSLGRTTAIRATDILCGHRATSIDAEVADAIGELTNMIAGAAKAQLDEHEMMISLPSVICGKHHSIQFPSTSIPIQLPFNSELGPVCVEFGFAGL